ncbi:MAG: acetamidase/formamidase family protein [Saprospiraceae bacterium]|nr:acetamidase/formamidase family protein [Saprospiraceae bacterium]
MKRFYLLATTTMLALITCTTPVDDPESGSDRAAPTPQFTLTKDQTHNKFSRTIPPVLRVPSGAVIEAFTEDASDGQFGPHSQLSALDSMDFEPIHPLTGPVYVEGAEPGDILKVTLHAIEVGSWGWNAIIPGFGFLADTISLKYLRIYELSPEMEYVQFNDTMRIPLAPFPGVMGVAPATDSLLSTIPPRANGGNMDDPFMTEGVSVYFPVFVEGALFSIGDGHAAQGLGEVCGTAIEVPLRIIYEVEVLKGRSIPEPQYESAEYYATTGFATTIDEAARKATLYMVEYLSDVHGLPRDEAYALCSLSGDLHIAEVVDVPHMLVTMHMPKAVIGD